VQTPLPALAGEMGWIPPKILRHIEILRLWFRLNQQPLNRLSRWIFDWDYSFTQQGKPSGM